MLPLLHLNGYKIANPTVLARLSHDELEQRFTGYGYPPWFVEGDDPAILYQAMAAALDEIIAAIRSIQSAAHSQAVPQRPRSIWR